MSSPRFGCSARGPYEAPVQLRAARDVVLELLGRELPHVDAALGAGEAILGIGTAAELLVELIDRLLDGFAAADTQDEVAAAVLVLHGDRPTTPVGRLMSAA